MARIYIHRLAVLLFLVICCTTWYSRLVQASERCCESANMSESNTYYNPYATTISLKNKVLSTNDLELIHLLSKQNTQHLDRPIRL